MSGGSYDYLCYKGSEDIRRHTKSLESMAVRLAGLGYAEDAAKETTALLLTLRQQEVFLDTYIARLSGLWRAVEWWDSGDSGEAEVKAALAKYRGQQEG